MTARRRFAVAWLIVGTLAASDVVLALALITTDVSWWLWPVGAAVVFHAVWLAMAWWKFGR
jgi:hypothetical protein